MVSEMMTKDARPAERETPRKLLIADDQPHILEALRLLLKPEGYDLEMVRTPELAVEAVARESFDGVLVRARRGWTWWRVSRRWMLNSRLS
jgi:PleD family two-component response regulator